MTVQIQHSNNGAVTNAAGQFQLENASAADTLIATYVGYEVKKIPVGNQTTLEMSLSPSASQLDQIVVIGYGTAKKKDLTGAITRIDMSDKMNNANVNLLQSLAGAAAGLNVDQGGGAAGNPGFSIRGQTSLSGSVQPLIVLDGAIFYGNIDDINPNDVESVDVLKGASAAAVYGRRSANGVLIINTKKGRAGKSVFSLSAYAGFQGMTNNPVREMNGDEFALRLLDWTWERDVYNWYATHPTSEAGRPARPDATDRETVASFLRTPEEKKNYLAGKGTDWVDEVLRQAPMQNYDISLTGGSKDGITYYLSGSFSNIKGIQKNDQFKRSTVHSSLSDKINDWLEIGLDATYSHRDNSGIPASLSAARVASPLQLNNPLGSPDYQIYLGGELYQVYPLVYTYADNSDIRTNLFSVGTININIPWVKGLKYTLRYSRLHQTENNNTFYSDKTINGVDNNGEAVKNPIESNNWILDNIVNYSNSFGDHEINATLLFSREKGTGSSSTLSATDFGIENLGYNDMELGQFPVVASTAYEENSLSYMARGNYSYRSKYLLTGTVRKDGYSGFSPNHKWATFPSVGAGWVLTEEPFLKDKGFYLKLRLSYGINGNQGIGRYASFSQMNTYDYVYGSQTAIGIYPTTLGNKELTWEKTSSTDLGIDFNFLHNRIAGSVDLYTGKTKDVLVERQIPRASGYTSVWSNLGQISNKGIDLEINSVNVKGAFNWTTKFTFSLNRNKIQRLYGDGGDKDIGNSWFVGEPIKSIYDYKILGVWQEQDLFNKNIYEGWYPGQFKYADINNDGKIEPVNDREIIGYASPSYRFSLANMLSYKNFTLSIFINSIQGGKKYYLANNFAMVNPAYDFSFRMNTPAINPYWRPDRPTTNTTGIYNTPPVESGIYQSRSFVRLQDISLSYSLPSELIHKINIQSAQVYVSSKNPYVWTKWQGWDPETGTSDTPLMRNIIFGLRLSF
ncbi:TonB-dependent receptor [Compostibacter hankyongensis]|uniref:TonB-dependent receptor n=1 Tax=Compostibacter hankyongensis TaxID=1007089 RepID=A0ABP8FPM4_9BACT